ncbi:response regulator transcription factor [Herpetosiphon sp.]|uniref:Two component transcriptional regulator, LuxR family n=1 Tax=Herpetosiphon aurantiacus (strain ATCC 23779 / DSM 785 / 114-95) TaxID=316274 RepID=A9AZR3_HERA2|nr:response regulator transcription factor [Herpetosiphon sp.]ABX07117.1 two component transcriptional regulator, LuxR family [Herpetosiphon aurantiacus DSM 785]
MTNIIRIMLVDDHAIVREGLRTLLAEDTEFLIVGEAQNGADAIELAAVVRPHVILMDLVMPNVDGIQATQALQSLMPSSRIIVLTSFSDDQWVSKAIQAGASGYLLKNVLKAELFLAIRTVANGQPFLHAEAQRTLMRQSTAPPSLLPSLTERERSVLDGIVGGLSNKEIARSLHLTEGTVKGYVSTILTKLAVADRTQAALYAIKHGFDLTQ